MPEYARLIPEGVLALGAIAVLFAEHLPGVRRSAAGFGALVALLAAIAARWTGTPGALFGGMLTHDGTAGVVRVALPALSAMFLLWVAGRGFGGERPREAVGLVLAATLGGMLMSAASDLVTLYISLELATMPAYVLMGYTRGRERNLEGALKYYLLSLLTSLVMLYGLALFYAVAGSTAYASIDLRSAGPVTALASLFVAVGFLAKMSAAPFHYWAPDAYAGAPAPAVAFVSSVPKIAAVAAMARLFTVITPQVPSMPAALAVAAIASMLLGNLAAYPQSDVRRLMAYSGIAHVGYLLVALAAGTDVGASAAVFYSIAYAVPSMAIVLISAEEGLRLDDLRGLSVRRPWTAWLAVGFLLSLVGIPPLAGFFGKLYLFSAALASPVAWLVGLVVVAALMSAVSLGFYFRIVRVMFAAAPEERAVEAVAPSLTGDAALALLFAATLLLGVASAPVLAALGFALP